MSNYKIIFFFNYNLIDLSVASSKSISKPKFTSFPKELLLWLSNDSLYYLMAKCIINVLSPNNNAQMLLTRIINTISSYLF